MKRLLGNLCVTAIIVILLTNFAGAFDVATFIANFEDGKDQTVLVGQIDSLTIIRGPAEFYLGKGELTLLDFGCGRPCGMVFTGPVHFIYSPPDEIERYQLNKFTGKDTLDSKFDDITFFYTVELNNLPDTVAFVKNKPDKNTWKLLEQTRKSVIEYLSMNVTSRILGDLLSDNPGLFFLTNFENAELGDMIFCEDSFCEDYYRLYRLGKKGKEKIADVINGYTPDNKMLLREEMALIDITDYDIEAEVDSYGKLKANCQINYIAMREGQPIIYFRLSVKNDIKKAIDSDGNPLLIVRTENEPGFGLVLNKPLESGGQDFIDIEYGGKPFHNEWGVFYCQDSSTWYPLKSLTDKAKHEISLKYPSEFLFSSYDQSVYDTTSKGKWEKEYETAEAGICFGKLNVSESKPDSKIRIVMFAPSITGWSTSLYVGESYEASLIEGLIGLAGSKVWFDNCYKDISYDLTYFKQLLNYCPFDSIAVFETPFQNHRGYIGAIGLSSYFETDKEVGGGARLGDPLVRAREAAYQWWGHSVSAESYRDEWIIEGLAQYCGLLSVQSREPQKYALDSVLSVWRDTIIAVQSEAGPVYLGRRLFSSEWDYYDPIAIKKSAYIFNMIRNIFHDYGTGSDKRFIAFVQDLYAKYKNKTITTNDFKNELTAHAKMDMTWFLDQWVYGTAIPKYNFSFITEKPSEGEFMVNCHIEQEGVPDGFKMMVPLGIVYDDSTQIDMPMWIDQAVTDIQLPTKESGFQKIIFNTYDAVLCKVKYK